MVKSFLDLVGYPLGLRNNNPGNLRPLPNGAKWLGEIAPDTLHNFSRFSNIEYGLRAMITDLLGDIRNDGLTTIRKLITAYAPQSDFNNTSAYINSVSQYTGLPPDAPIPLTRDFITKLIKAQLNVELGATWAAKITETDIHNAMSILSNTVKKWLIITTGGAAGILLIIAALFF